MSAVAAAALAPGAGVLEVAQVGGRSVVTRASAASPLKLLEPRNHGEAAWVFAASFGGGLVDGDRVALAVRVGAGSALLVGTQAQTKVYRGAAEQRLTAAVEPGGLLVLLPDPVACFAGASYAQRIEVTLAEDASLVLLDGLTCGRAAHGERWAFSRYASHLSVTRAGAGAAPLVADGLVLDPAHGPLAARMGRFQALATVLALGPRALALAAPPQKPRADLYLAVSPVQGGALARIAATTVERTGQAVHGLLGGLGALLGDDPFTRKW